MFFNFLVAFAGTFDMLFNFIFWLARPDLTCFQNFSLVFAGTFDILADEAVRQALKTYSNWPTYPQLYHKGELVGGLDILKVCCR